MHTHTHTSRYLSLALPLSRVSCRMPTGLVTTWLEEKGFGFIAPDDPGHFSANRDYSILCTNSSAALFSLPFSRIFQAFLSLSQAFLELFLDDYMFRT